MKVSIILLIIFYLCSTSCISAQFLEKLEKITDDFDKITTEIDRTLNSLDRKKNNDKKNVAPKRYPNDTETSKNKKEPRKIETEGRKGRFYDKGRENFIDDEDELFYCFGEHSTQYLYSEEQVIEKTKRNILTKDKDETTFLRKFFIFHINNKKVNKELLKCDEKTLTVTVIEREPDGLPKKVRSTYYYKDILGKILTQKREIQIYFEAGLPYYISYPNEIGWAVYPNREGVIGSLIYANSDIAKMVSLNDRDEKIRREYRTKFTNPKINDSLSNLIVKKFPGLNCSTCLGRSVLKVPQERVTELTNGYGQKRYETEYFTDYQIKIENKCNKALKVVGISQGYENGVKAFGFVWRKFKPKEVIKFTRSSNDLAGGMIASILLGGGEMKDIDLEKINKKYDVENTEIQYLRIIEDK